MVGCSVMDWRSIHCIFDVLLLPKIKKKFRACDRVSLNVTAQSRAVGQLNYDRSTELLCKLQRPLCQPSLSIPLVIHAGHTTEAVGLNFPRFSTTEECWTTRALTRSCVQGHASKASGSAAVYGSTHRKLVKRRCPSNSTDQQLLHYTS